MYSPHWNPHLCFIHHIHSSWIGETVLLNLNDTQHIKNIFDRKKIIIIKRRCIFSTGEQKRITETLITLCFRETLLCRCMPALTGTECTRWIHISISLFRYQQMEAWSPEQITKSHTEIPAVTKILTKHWPAAQESFVPDFSRRQPVVHVAVWHSCGLLSSCGQHRQLAHNRRRPTWLSANNSTGVDRIPTLKPPQTNPRHLWLSDKV